MNYTIRASLDPKAHTIEGHETITLRNVSTAPLRDLRLHLYLNAFKNDLSIFRRARVGNFRGDHRGVSGLIDVKKLVLVERVEHAEGSENAARERGEKNEKRTDLWPQHEFVSHLGDSPQDSFRKGDKFPFPGAADDETDVRVPLENEVAPGASIELEIDFRVELADISERTGYAGSFDFAGQWFPKLAKLDASGWSSFAFHHLGEFYADYGTYDVTIDVPENFTIGASGVALESKIENGRRIERHTIDDVHDFAFTAWDGFVTREEREGNVLIRHLAPKGYQSATDREIISVVHTLREYGARFGPYPYSILTVVHPPSDAGEAGGMEYPSLITTGGSWLPAHGSHEVEAVTVHELGHQWFYGLIGTHEVEWPAGDEGFNSFAELGGLERLFGAGSAFGLPAFGVSTLAYAHARTDATEEPIFEPTYEFADGSAYGSRVYSATSIVLATLQRSYGAARFDAAMGVYARRFRFKHPKPDDFFGVLDEIVGIDCGAAARAALTTASSLDLYVDSVSSVRAHPPRGTFDLPTGRTKKDSEEGDLAWQSAAWIARRGIVDLPVDVELRFADGSRRRETVRFGPSPTMTDHRGATWRRIDADGPSQLIGVVIDPELKIPLDRLRLNNFAVPYDRRTGAPVARERAFAWIGALTREVGP
ncbi:MAG: M1 family metallopeptidase [Polyangiales bacterium]